MASVYQVVTDRVIEQLEKGTAPWRRQWGGEFRFPVNLASGKTYRGVNSFVLSCFGYSSPYWLTYRQAEKLGGHVRKGEKGCPIIFWKEWKTKDRQTGEDIKLPVLRYSTGFNVAQCELPDGAVPALDEPAHDFTPIERCQRLLTRFELKPSIRHEFAKPFYRPHDDLVGMPKPEAFDNAEAYYAILFHELTHSTGHTERLNRKGITELAAFGSDSYGREELIAEMGAAFLCGESGIETATLDNTASYVAGWLKILRKDSKLVVQAAAAAQKAADHILGRKWEGGAK